MTAAIATLALLTLATARAARLIALDRIALPLRRRLIAWRGPDSAITYLAHCPWCLSVWLAAAAAPIAWATTSLPAALAPTPAWVGIPATWGAIAYLAGRIVTSEKE